MSYSQRLTAVSGLIIAYADRPRNHSRSSAQRLVQGKERRACYIWKEYAAATRILQCACRSMSKLRVRCHITACLSVNSGYSRHVVAPKTPCPVTSEPWIMPPIAIIAYGDTSASLILRCTHETAMRELFQLEVFTVIICQDATWVEAKIACVATSILGSDQLMQGHTRLAI